jgi:hypothetical protein
MSDKAYGRLTAGLVIAWFFVALVASALYGFKTGPNTPPLALGLAVLAPIALFGLWYIRSAGFRRFVLSLDPRTLTFVQSWRIVGFTFLVLYAAGLLPGTFALPAGWGDIAIGATAPLIAIKFTNGNRRNIFVLWQILGILDLVVAVTTGTLSQQLNPQGASTEIMTLLPLSLIPTFGVPLLAILHIICIAQARHWKERRISDIGDVSPLSV